MTHEARQFVSVEGKFYFIASAIISDSLAVKLMVNFFNSFYKHPVPFKMFSTEEEARKWLDGFRG